MPCTVLVPHTTSQIDQHVAVDPPPEITFSEVAAPAPVAGLYAVRVLKRGAKPVNFSGAVASSAQNNALATSCDIPSVCALSSASRNSGVLPDRSASALSTSA